MSSSMRPKVTNVRLTPLSINSTHMNMTSTLRRTSSPTPADAEEDGGQDQVPGSGDGHSAATSSCSACDISLATGRWWRDRTTAATTAMTRRAAVISNGNRYRV